MKKTCLVLALVICILSCVSCSVKPYKADDYKNDFSSGFDFETEEETVATPPESANPSETTTAPTTTTSTPTTTTVPASNSNYEWKEFLADYEDWVDDYVAFMKKYKANPTDFSLLTDYAKMSAKAIEWSNKASEIQEDLSPAELTEYMQTLSRITQKLASIT